VFAYRLTRTGAIGTTIFAFGLIASAPADAQSGNGAAGQERCYGVAEAGENVGLDGAEAPGSSSVDYQGNAWVWVETGTCLRMALPVQPDGTPRRGALEPIARDRP